MGVNPHHCKKMFNTRVSVPTRNAREAFQGPNKPDSIDDQRANRWGRNGGNPNRYRPKGLPSKY